MAQEDEPKRPDHDTAAGPSRGARSQQSASGSPEQAPDDPEEDTAEETGMPLEDELRQAQERILRLTAEMENVRRRNRKELEDQLRYANLPLLRDLLPVLDNVTRALEAAEKTHDSKTLAEGVQLVGQQLRSVLTQHNCQEIAALNEHFDPHKHEAVMQQPSQDQPPGTVVMVVQPGYQLHDRVIRPSQVIVAAPPPDRNEP